MYRIFHVEYRIVFLLLMWMFFAFFKFPTSKSSNLFINRLILTIILVNNIANYLK